MTKHSRTAASPPQSAAAGGEEPAGRGLAAVHSRMTALIAKVKAAIEARRAAA